MTNREQLIEQYEDARFALLMEELAEEEGAELLRLNDALLTDPAAAVPKGAERRGEQLIGAAFAKRRRHAAGRTAGRWLTRLLLAAALGTAMFAAAFALNENVRVKTLNTILTVEDAFTKLTFQKSEDRTEPSASRPVPPAADGLDYHYDIALEWTPEGYELTGGSVNSGCHAAAIQLFSPTDGEIYITFTPIDPSLTYNINSEDCTRKDVTVQGYPASLYITNEDMLQRRWKDAGLEIWSDLAVFWIDEQNQQIVHVDATNLTEDEILRLAEGGHWAGASS